MINTTRLLVYDPKNARRSRDRKVRAFEIVERAFRAYYDKNSDELERYWQGGDYCVIYHYSPRHGEDATIDFVAVQTSKRRGSLADGVKVRVVSTTLDAKRFKPELEAMLKGVGATGLKVEVRK